MGKVSDSNKSTLSVPAWLLVFGGLIIALIALHIWWASTFWSQMAFFFRMQSPWMIPLVLCAIAVIAAGLATEEGYASAFILWPLVVVLLVSVFVLPNYIGYQRGATYAKSTEVTTEAAIEFEIRTPYTVATRMSKTALGNLTGGDIDRIKYTASANNAEEFTILVRNRSMFAGYLAVVNLDGERCMFSDKADRRIGGPFAHSLLRAVNKVERFVYLDDNDVYGYCDEDGAPIVVAPLTKVVGFWVPREVPAGVALYNGSTGELTIDKDVAVGDIPGPVYPQSLSAAVRSSLSATGTWWEYFRNTVGYITTINDDEDPNAENRSEYGLQDADGNGYYVTPFTTNGGSASISALGIQEYGSVTNGEMNPYSITTYKAPQESNGQAASNIRAKFSSLSWQNGMNIYEITPLNGADRVATLGLNQAIQYRVVISPDEYCLTDLKGAEIKCLAIDDAGTDVATADGTGSIPLTSTTDLSTLTDEELIELLSGVASEQQSRLGAE